MNSAAFSVLPLLSYIIVSLLVGYVAIRLHRYVWKRRSLAATLPRPVNETLSSKSPLSFVRSTSWVWPHWTLPVPWSRSPAVSNSKSKAASTASTKNLTLELLPTSALPPPPTSVPTLFETPHLLDLSSPPPIPLQGAPTDSERHTAVLSSQRKSPLPLFRHQTHRPHSIIANRNIQRFSRPPSPHALLATTPPLAPHRRSRSLGGFPIRRLSGGQSGLRNKVDVEMREFVSGHSRDASQEHLLIDFSSSVTEDEIGPESDGNRLRISPAASDIGVMPVSGKVVEPCPVPLVDLEDDSAGAQKFESESENWMWFGPSAPSTVRRYDARSPPPSVKASGEAKFSFPFPLPLPLPKTEKLVFSHIGEEGGFDSLDSSETLVDIESASSEKDHQQVILKPIGDGLDDGATVDLISDLPINPFDDEYAAKFQPPSSVDQQPDAQLVDIDDHEYETRVQPLTNLLPSHHPLEDLIQVDVKLRQTSYPISLLTESRSRSDLTQTAFDRPELESHWLTEPSTSLSPLISTDAPIPLCTMEPSGVGLLEPVNWLLKEPEDLWGTSSQNQALLSESANVDLDLEKESIRTQVVLSEKEYMETSPGGSLLPTVLDEESADDEVPALDLDDLGMKLVVQEQDEDEEDVTPRPTPASVNDQLPVSNEDSLVPTILVENRGDDLTENNLEDVTSETEGCPDPGLLPLPELLLSSVETLLNTDVECKSTNAVQLPSQIPTPPASPPSTSPIRLSPTSPNPRKAGKSLPASPRSLAKNLNVATETMKVGFKSRTTSPCSATDPLPIEVEEKNGQLTPVPREPLRAAEPVQSEHEAKEVAAEVTVMEIDEDEANQDMVASPENKQGTSLPGSFPRYSEPSSSVSTAVSASTRTTMAARLATNPGQTRFHPSVRAIVRQPVEIALAMQLRPGLGAGADPAWMVRFLMAMFGWFAVLVSGQENY